MSLPATLSTEAELDAFMTEPSEALVTFMQTLDGPLLVLGAGGKMGPSLCIRARRAAEAAGREDLDVVAVSRFSDPAARATLEQAGVRTLACDLLDPDALADLPDARSVVFLVGMKFGTAQAPERTWAVNTLVPAHVCRRYPGARIAALSTGNVYGLTPAGRGGSREQDPPAPEGEYANACLARERMFEYFSAENGTPVVLIRLNYAVDLRYGVLVDLAQRLMARQAVDVTMGYVNCIWQGDANDMILRSLDLAVAPPRPLNLTGPRALRVRGLAEALAARLGVDARIIGEEAKTALLSDPSRAVDAFGHPPTPIETVLKWTADWIERGGPTLDKPTHFEVRDGVF